VACTIDVRDSIHIHYSVEGNRIFPGAFHRGDGGWRCVVNFVLFFQILNELSQQRMIEHTVKPEDHLLVGRRHLDLEAGGKKVEIEHVITRVVVIARPSHGLWNVAHGLGSPW